jgi:predicted ATPase
LGRVRHGAFGLGARQNGQAEKGLDRLHAGRDACLLAATSLARLLARQERCAEARDFLAPVYGWFTEGFPPADLKEAKALLGQLA